jgi:transcription antitermination factor NusG
MFTKKNWYIIYTQTDCERKVTALLLKNNIEAYCPLIVRSKQWSDRKKRVEAPLFNSYVFVYGSVDQLATIKQMPGVVSLVHWLNKPAIVNVDEIMAIKNFISNYKRISLEKMPVNRSETVRVIDDPLMNRDGNVIQIRYRMVKIALPSMGYTLIAEFEKSGIQVVNGEEKKQSLVS